MTRRGLAETPLESPKELMQMGSVRARYSRRPLAQLAPIRLSQLRLGYVHTGRYVLCRTLVTPYKLRAVGTVGTDCPEDGEDEGDGACQRWLAVYNLVTKEVPGPSADVSRHCLPAGTVLAIKEPYFKEGSADLKHIIRVDSPSDLLVISDPQHPLVAGTAWERHVAAAAAAGAVRGNCSGASAPLLTSSVATAADAGAADADEAARWQVEGNALFGSGQFVDALHAYQQGLAALLLKPLTPLSEEGTEEQQVGQQQKRAAVLLNNSAAACLGFRAFNAARAYAQLVLKREPRNAKALMRLAKALDGLGRYTEAAEAWEAHLAAASYGARSTTAAAAQRFLAELRRRAAQAERGEYDEAALAREAAASSTPRLEGHADFIGPVAVADAGGGRGRGLFATAPVRAGQLLLAMRADAVCYEAEVHTAAIPQMSSIPGVVIGPSQSQLILDLPISMLGCPRLAARLAHLHARRQSWMPPVPPAAECGFIPTWRPAAAAAAATGVDFDELLAIMGKELLAEAASCEQLVAAECGGAAQYGGSCALARGLIEVSSEGYVGVSDVLLERITSTHVVKPEPLPEIIMRADGESVEDEEEAQEGGARGLWSLASYANHSCCASATRYFIGDFMFVRAACDLPAGAEVTLSRIFPMLPYGARCQALRDLGLTCSCELCLEDREWSRRHPDQASLVDDLLFGFRAHIEPIAYRTAGSGAAARQLARRVQGLVRKLEDATAGRVWRTALFWPTGAIAMLLQSCGDTLAAITAFEQALVAAARFPGGAGAKPSRAAADAAAYGSLYYLIPDVVQAAVNIAATWADTATIGARGQRQQAAARQQAQRWEATAREIWSRFYGSQELFDLRFAEPLRLIHSTPVTPPPSEEAGEAPPHPRSRVQQLGGAGGGACSPRAAMTDSPLRARRGAGGFESPAHSPRQVSHVY